jgi:putative spermidine/putrescine transport system substrate-binding protein
MRQFDYTPVSLNWGNLMKYQLILAGSAFLAAGQAFAENLTVASWGGVYVTSQINAYGNSFETKHDATIFWEEYAGGLVEIRKQIQVNDVRWDVLDVFAHDAINGCDEGLFMELPQELLASFGDDLIIPPPSKCAAPNNIWAWVSAYDGRAFSGDEPQTIADFFDVTGFPGKRAIASFPQANLEMALVADGVEPSDVYRVLDTDEGLARAFAKLSSIQEHLTFWTSGEAPIDMLLSGEVVMSTAYSGRVASAVLSGRGDLGVIWDGQVLDTEWFTIAAGSAKRDLALEFIRHAGEPREQALLAKWIPYGPMRYSAIEIIKEEEPWFSTGQHVLHLLPNRPELLPRSVIADPHWWADNIERVAPRFEAWRQSLGF